MEVKIRWGLLGPGHIASKFIEDLKLVEHAQIVAVASRSPERAETFARQHGIEHSFGSYTALLESGLVDVVYIATPHSFHRKWTLEALDRGVAVLCEKPLGTSGGEVAEMVAMARERNVFLMEALWSRFNPSLVKVKELVDAGVLGELGYLHADFAFYALDRGLDSRLLDPALASGSLLDIGIYPIFLAYLMLGMPDTLQASSNFHENGTELQTSMVFQYPRAQAVLYSGLLGRSKMEAELSGTRGEIYIRPRWHAAEGFSLHREGGVEEFDLPLRGGGYYHEIVEVHRCLGAGAVESTLWSHRNSLDLAELLDRVRKKCGISFPFET